MALRLTSFWLLVFALPLLGCPAKNSASCQLDSDCTGGRCREGACGPFCLSDSDCGSAQVCTAGDCVPAPECSQSSDCAQGFLCTNGQCLCTSDSACASNQACLQGACVAKTPCKTDADCAAIGERCEVVSGTCAPACILPSDCAPGLSETVAATLYVCEQGDCLLRCLAAQTCGVGFICPAGVCQPAQCKTLTDCPAGQYCTDPNYGQCVAYQTCTQTSQCPANDTCKPFGVLSCPPGFPCQQPICQELPQCLVDGDCALANGLGPDAGESYCADGHCQPSQSCQTAADCSPSMDCVGGLCVPAVCRGLGDCPAPQACEGGVCVSGPNPGAIAGYGLTPNAATLEVGDILAFTLLAYRLDGSSFPIGSATYAVTDTTGQPSASVSVTDAGVATAEATGQVTVTAQVPGSVAQPATATLWVLGAPSGRRVVVVDSATSAPVSGARVLGCDGPQQDGGCAMAAELTTDATGQVTFAFSGATSSYSVASTALRSDGFPLYERVSVAQTASADLLVPLPYNWVQGAAGFTGQVDFSNVHTTGNYWAGFVESSEGDPTEVDLRLLLGDNVDLDIPGLGTGIAVPGSVVLFGSVGFGIPTAIKPTSDGLAQAGRRHLVGFAGRGNANQLLDLRSANVFAYAAYMDYQVLPFQAVRQEPDVAQVTDAGTQQVPDYAHFIALSFQPELQQQERTEVVIPNVDATFDTVILSSAMVSREEGVLPLGFSSAAAGLVGADGTRAVPATVVQSGAPYAGAEAGQPGIWAIALGLNGQTGGNGPQPLSARLFAASPLPTTVTLPDFLPQPEGSSYAASTRTFSPGQPQWNAAAAAGGVLAKLELTGSQNGHVVYFALQGTQASVPLPPAPPDAAGVDPAGETSVSLSVVVMSLGGLPASDALDLPGHNLTDLSTYLDGYSRFVH